MAFPLPPPPPPPGSGYPPPPQAGYGYPPGAGFLPPVGFGGEPPTRKNPSWVTLAVAVALGATVSAFVTHAADGPRTTVNFPVAAGTGNGTSTSLGDAELKSDLKSASIAEQSYATENAGKFVADVVVAGDGPDHPLVQQGLQVEGPVTVTAVVFSSSQPGDSYCLTAVSTQTPARWFLSSVDDVPTTVQPAGC